MERAESVKVTSKKVNVEFVNKFIGVIFWAKAVVVWFEKFMLNRGVNMYTRIIARIPWHAFDKI